MIARDITLRDYIKLFPNGGRVQQILEAYCALNPEQADELQPVTDIADKAAKIVREQVQ